MKTSKTIFLQTEACRVTEDEVVIEGHRYPLQNIASAKVVSDSGYQRKTAPFLLAVGFVVWTLSELVNGKNNYTYALIAAVLAAMSMVAVRLVGGLNQHVAWLTLPEGAVAVFQSSDSAAVVDLVMAVNHAKAYHRSQYAGAWTVGKPVNG